METPSRPPQVDWEDFARYFPIGTNFAGVVLEVFPYAARVQIAPGVVGTVRNGEISWDVEVHDAREHLTAKQRVQVQLLEVNAKEGRVSLSAKRALHDPWALHAATHSSGQLVRARVMQFARDDVIVELEDRISGFIPRVDVPLHGRRMEEVLEVGDWVEAHVVGLREMMREIQLSMKARLEEIERQVREPALPGSGEWSSPSLGTAEIQFDLPPVALSLLEHPLRVLIYENVDIERLQLRVILEDLGCKEIVEAATGRDAVKSASEREFDLFLLDLDTSDGEDSGTAAARSLRRCCPEVPIVLVTGNRPDQEWREKADVELSGMIAKPITRQRVALALERFLLTGRAGWPEEGAVPVDQEIPASARFLEGIARSALIVRPIVDVLSEVTRSLQVATGAKAVALFGWDRHSRGVSLEANSGLRTEDFDACLPQLHKSPVADLIYNQEQAFFSGDVQGLAHGKFLHLLPILGKTQPDGPWLLRSCIGEKLSGGFEKFYTIFVFGEGAYQFSPEHRALVRTASAMLSSAIREDWIIRQVVSERRLTTLGGIVTSVAHELNGLLNALAAAENIKSYWQRALGDRKLLNDEAFTGTMNELIESIFVARSRTDEFVGRILGWAHQGPKGNIVVGECLDAAIRACWHEAQKCNVAIGKHIVPGQRIVARAPELQQVFFNIILNALQHMKETRRPGGRLHIHMKLRSGGERPLQIRFRDTGPGIHSRHLDPVVWGEEPIFQPFFTTKSEGTGMGLYIVRGLLADIGGTIRVERTAILAGTTFLIELPVIGGLPL